MKALSIKNLTKEYPDGVTALSGISLDVESGDFFALLGPNGAGKSTTISIISSLIQPTSGKVSVFENDLDTQKNMAKTFIGLVPQEFNFNIFEKVLNIIVCQAGYYGIPENIALPRAEMLLKKLHLWDKRNVPSMALSGGMKRKLMIVRALIHEPKLLILDEPTAGVDVETRREMWDFLKELNENGTTIILTTHYLEEAETLCRNIAIIHKGKIAQNSSMKKLLSELDEETFLLDIQETNQKDFPNSPFPITLKDPNTLEVIVKKEQNLNAIFEYLQEQKIEIKSLRNETNRLEKLFINLTQ